MSATLPERAVTCPAQRGFSIVSTLFILVVLAALAAGLVQVSVMQHASATLDVQGVRAHQAARAGIEWGLYRILDPDGTPGATLPACWGAPESLALEQDLAPFVVSVSCIGPASSTELDRVIGVYRLTATATFGAAHSPNRVSRTVERSVSRCVDDANAASRLC